LIGAAFRIRATSDFRPELNLGFRSRILRDDRSCILARTKVIDVVRRTTLFCHSEPSREAAKECSPGRKSGMTEKKVETIRRGHSAQPNSPRCHPEQSEGPMHFPADYIDPSARKERGPQDDIATMGNQSRRDNRKFAR
jgi:hypothetical protein